jgi:ankyrin repeat protein
VVKILGKQGNEERLDMLKVLFPDDDPFLTFNFSEAHKLVFLKGGGRLESFQSSRLEKVDDLDRFGITALSWAARRGDDKSLIHLLDRGADPNICDVWGMAPIHFASNLSNPNSIQQLVSWRADVNKADGWGRNAFHYMTKTCSDTAFLEPIIEAGIDIDHLEYWGKPPLHVAAVCNNHQAVLYLLAMGAKTTYFDADKDSVVFEAVHHNSHEVLKILRDANADLGTVNRWGYTILHMAAIYADETTMDILNGIKLNDGCLSLRSADGLTPPETFSKREARSRSLDKAFGKLQMSIQARPQCSE